MRGRDVCEREREREKDRETERGRDERERGTEGGRERVHRNRKMERGRDSRMSDEGRRENDSVTQVAMRRAIEGERERAVKREGGSFQAHIDCGFVPCVHVYKCI